MDRRISVTPAAAIEMTRVTSISPKRLSKRAILRDGGLKFEAGGIMQQGKGNVLQVHNLSDLADVIASLGPSQALCFGRPSEDMFDIVTQKAWEATGRPDNPIPRSNETFAWPEGPAVMMVDYDPMDGSPALTRDELVAAIRDAVPGLKDVAMLHVPSSSSFIYNEGTGEELSGLRGQRLYLLLQNGQDIPRAGKALFDRLWLKGHGFYRISSSGSLLSRSIVDGTVWQPSRLDFAAGAICARPLIQRRGDPFFVSGQVECVDTQEAIPDLDKRERNLVENLKRIERESLQDEALKVRNAWLDARVSDIADTKAGSGERDAIRADLEASLDGCTLSGKFPIYVQTGGKLEAISVRELLEAPLCYDGCLTRDAFEPDYDSGRLVGKLFLSGSKPTLHSFARGGVTYRLQRDLRFVTVLSGQTDQAVEEVLELLRDDPNYFDFGNELVWVDDGKIHVMDQFRLEQKFGDLIQFQKLDSKGNPKLIDPPAALTKRVLSLGTLRHLKPLDAVISAPTLRPDGSVLDQTGYDVETKLFLHMSATDEQSPVPLYPTRTQAKEALQFLMDPFKDFPFVSNTDRSVMLSALLSAAVRGTLPTCPGFGFDAPTQGSGKTLLAKCIAVMAGDLQPQVFPHSSGRDDEEVRKRLMSFFRTGTSALVWDNILGVFNSASMAAALTSETFSDRVLGKSETAVMPNKALFLFTGNNLMLQDDLVRRILICRIDPGMDQPFKRKFELDPLEYVRQRRAKLICAALILLRGYLSADQKLSTTRLASYEAWDDWVRSCVRWIGTAIDPTNFDDPTLAIDRMQENDPTREAHYNLLVALYQQFKNNTFTSAELHRNIGREPNVTHSGKFKKIYESIETLRPGANTSSSIIGKTLGYRIDRVVDGLVLKREKDRHSKSTLWRVETV